MIRLKNPRLTGEMYLSLPEAQPVTLYEVPGDNLPYACQCPLCGGLFEIPAGVLYKLEDDHLPDKESNIDFKNISGGGIPAGGGIPGGSPAIEDTSPPPSEEGIPV